MLNRAPTLHRLGIQAFEPVLVEGKAIKIHPLVCTAFNADFDGDQMAVHIPLSPEAQIEASVLMLASHNILSPASGQPITVPTQDLVLGIYYLTKSKVNAKGEGRVFANIEEVFMALEAKQVETLTPIRLRYTGPVLDMTTAYDDQDLTHTEPVEFNRQYINTTVGRAILNDALPEGMPYVNGLLKKKGIGQLINYCYLNLGLEVTVTTLARVKDLADTALKTADWGYLTRRLVDVAQDVIISHNDCGTVEGIYVTPIIEAGETIEPLRDRIIGRVSLEKLKDFEGKTIVDINQEIDEDLANAVQAAGIERVKIRSVLTCESKRGVCILCYGRNLGSGKMVEMGEAVGVIAAQSIGEPGTQLTMRTFHIGGTASRVSDASHLESKNNGTVRFINLVTVRAKSGDLVAMNRNGSIAIVDDKGREKERYAIVYGAKLKVEEGTKVTQGSRLGEWDPYTFSLLTEISGTVQFKVLQEAVTLNEECDEVTGLSRLVVADSSDQKH